MVNVLFMIAFLAMGIIFKDNTMFILGYIMMLKLELDEIKEMLKNGAILKIESPIRDKEKDLGN